jgi:predicted N-formylglutamate amidohydrolase
MAGVRRRHYHSGMADSERASPGAAIAGDPAFAAVETIPGDPAGGLVILCDHASNALPPEYGDLGLPAGEFQRHIAFDIGAAALTRRIAAALGAPAVLSRFSRLLIDPNRGADDPTLIMRLSDGAVVPGNARVDAQERERRLERYYLPYHAAVARALDAALATGRSPAILSVHSFTPAWKGRPRPWHAGILWDLDPRLAVPLIDALRADASLVVGDNEPYAGALKGDTLYRHGSQRGLAHALIEVRQDLIGDDRGVEEWAVRLVPILARLKDDPTLRALRHFGSRSDGNS